MAVGRTKQEQEALDRYWKGMLVIEAPNPIWVYPQKKDTRGAIKGDPEECALAHTFQRQFSSTAVVILRTRAYVDLQDDDGIRKVFRFILPKKTQRSIRHFDQTGAWLPGGLCFDPPTPSQRLDSQRAYQRKHESVIKGRSKVKGKGKQRNKRSNAQTLLGVRDGQGMVHFNKKNKNV